MSQPIQTKALGLRKRWMLNSLSAVILLVVLAVVGFSVVLSTYYYSNMSESLKAKARVAASFIENNTNTSAEYTAIAGNYVDTFEEKDRLELQLISTRGRIQFSSYGLTAGTAPNTDDIAAAIASGDVAQWTGEDPQTGERIMAVSTPLIIGGRTVGLIRYVSSLRLVDRQVIVSAVLAIVVGAAVLAIVYASNLFFIRSIVEPVGEINEITKRIAAGSYGVTIGKKFNDEIGELTDTINDMSIKISQTEKMKSEFLSSISHELRTPLTAISGWGETLLSGELQDKEEVNKGLSIIVSEAQRLTQMVEELLDFSRLADGRFTLSIAQTDVRSGFEDAVFTYREFCRRTGIRLEYIPPMTDIPAIAGDPDRLRQVFSNLLDNAAKHGGSGGRIVASLAFEGGKVIIRIRDFGPGIPPEELAHVKYMFYKGSSRARGNGIGLAVCDQIVALHGGTLTLENAEGGGVLVTVALPVSQ